MAAMAQHEEDTENGVVSLAGREGFTIETKKGDFVFKPYLLVSIVNPSLPASDTTPFSVSSSCCAIAANERAAITTIKINFFIIACIILIGFIVRYLFYNDFRNVIKASRSSLLIFLKRFFDASAISYSPEAV